MRPGDDFRFYPPSRPRAAKGGIRSQSKRGEFGESWWAKRWLAVLETFQLGGRLQRGRSYARSGQVLAIEVEKGVITARVQGSRATPYRVSIEVKPLSQKEWQKLAAAVASQAIFGAKLLAGEMPREIETVFGSARLSLFPARRNDLTTECSCPDWSNPCKHIAAVYYLLGEEFDRDPFLIFKMRGMSREEFLALLGGANSQSVPVGERLPDEPLPTSPALFWTVGALPDDLPGPPPEA
ncbi:MAG: SWIM zinc finger family protein, partial [Bryobacteraceae bacterium]